MVSVHVPTLLSFNPESDVRVWHPLPTPFPAVAAADDDTAQMVWTPRQHSTTQPTILGWGVELCGWPPCVPWQCPGHIRSLRQLQDIVKALYRGEMFFRRLRPVEICRYARELEVESPVVRPLRPVESRAKRLFRSAGVQTDEVVGDWSADLKG